MEGVGVMKTVDRTTPTLAAPERADAAGTARAVVTTDLARIVERLGPELELLAGRHLLLTGGAGFLGHYLAQAVVHANGARAAADRTRLTVLDNYARGVPEWLERLAADDAVTLLRHDVTQPLPDAVDDFDYAIHAASIASPTYYRRAPLETMDANVLGIRLLLERARARQERGDGPRGILFFSTSEIYGDPTPDQIPTPETYRGNVSCTGPRACYDESKRYGETLCVTFARQYGVPVSVARPFNNYGPGLPLEDGRVLPDFARDVLAGRDIVLLSDGSPTRTFCYVADAVVGYYGILARGRRGEAYNIGAETPEVSMAELAERVAEAARELFGYTGRVVRQRSADGDYLTDNPQRRCPDIAKARAELGFAPEMDLDEGIRRSLLWYAARHAAAAQAAS